MGNLWCGGGIMSYTEKDYAYSYTLCTMNTGKIHTKERCSNVCELIWFILVYITLRDKYIAP